MQAADKQQATDLTRQRLDPHVVVCRMLRSRRQFREVPEKFHPQGTAKLRSLLRVQDEEDVCEREQKPATIVVGIAGLKWKNI